MVLQARDHGRQRADSTGGSFSAAPVTLDQMADMVPHLDTEHFRGLQTDRRLAEQAQQAQQAPVRELVGAGTGHTGSSGDWRREVIAQPTPTFEPDSRSQAQDGINPSPAGLVTEAHPG